MGWRLIEIRQNYEFVRFVDRKLYSLKLDFVLKLCITKPHYPIIYL